MQLILEFKNSFGKYHPVFPKIILNWRFLGHPVYIYFGLLLFYELIIPIFLMNWSQLNEFL